MASLWPNASASSKDAWINLSKQGGCLSIGGHSLTTDVSNKDVRGDRLGARPCSLQNEGADPAASIGRCSRQAFVPTINDDSGVDWIHNVQARLYASAGVFTVVALKRD